MKKLALLLFFSISTILLPAQAPPAVEVAIEQIQAGPADEVCLTLTVQNFSDVQGMQWGLRWNPDVLAFTQLTDFNLTDLDLSDFNIGAAPEGFIRLSWFTLQAPFSVSVPDQTAIVDICFRIRESAPYGFSSVAFDNELITTEFVVDPDLYDSQVVEQPQMQTGGVQITAPGVLSLAPEFGTGSACGGNTSTIEVTPINGVAPFTYQWTGPNNFSGNQSRIIAPEPGTYEVRVTDAAGQQASGYFPVSIHGNPDPDIEPLPDFILTSVVENATCEESDGSITVIPDSEEQYAFLWSTGDTTVTAANLAPGTYQLEVTNRTGCTQSYSFTVGQNEGFDGITLVSDSLSCTEDAAQIGIIAGSTGNYTYLWNTGDTTSLITTSEPGQYEVMVTSEVGCTLPFQFDVGEAQLDLLFNRVDGNLGCTDTIVTIGLLMQQDINGLEFQWADGPTTPQRTVQQPGTYRLQVKQGTCLRDFTFRVEQQEDGPLFYQPINQPFSCTESTAQIGVNALGNLDYEFSWENRPETTGVIEVATEGTYILNINSGRCSVQETFTVAPFTEPDLTFVQRFDEQLNCNPQDSARIGLRAASGTRYAYQWSTGDTTQLISVADTQTYQLTVTEGVCLETFSFRVGLDPVKEYDLLLDDITCSDTVAEIGITNAPDYFRLDLSPPDSSVQRIQTPDPGIYNLTVLGGERCIFTEQIQVVTGNDLSAYNRLDDRLDCTGIDTAAIGLQTFPGFGESLNYTWNTGATDPVIAVTTPGEYEVTVSGNGNCAERYLFSVPTRSTDISYERVENQLNCRDNTTPIGVTGVRPDRAIYTWSNNDTMAISNISLAGTYQLTITDPLTQCQRIETFNQAPREIRQAGIVGECAVSDLCGGQARYTATVTDGLAPFIYRWNTGQTDTTEGSGTITLTQLADVAVTVTDARGCQVELAADALPCTPLNEFKARMYFDCTDNAEAPEGLLNAEVLSGGLPPYRYEWNIGLIDTSYFQSSVPFDAGVGTYNVTVTDATGRQQTLTFQDTDLYSCGNEQTTTLTYLAPHLTVEPEGDFSYTIQATNYANVDRSIYTIDWDPCIVQADTIRLYREEDTLTFTDLIPLEGTYEVSVERFDPTQLPDTITIAEIIFTPQKPGVSPFVFAINEPVRDTAGNSLPVRPSHGSITVAGPAELVQAGDTDNDGFIDQYDLLPLGLGFGQKGPDRRRELTEGSEFAYVWTEATPRKGINYRYLDGDGSGQINGADALTINQNWRPAQRNYSSTPGAPRLTVAEKTLAFNRTNIVSINLGDETLPASDLYGLAFTLEYDGTQIDPQSIAVAFDTSWLVLADELRYVRHEVDQQRIHFAISGINQQARSGSGAIAQVALALFPSAEGTTAMRISNVLAINAQEEVRPIAFGSTDLMIDDVSAQRNLALDARITVFPNPAKERVFVQTPPELFPQELQVRDMSGRIVATENNRQAIDVGLLPEGLYVLYIKTEAGLAIKKFAIGGR